jgi:hypothetical protein
VENVSANHIGRTSGKSAKLVVFTTRSCDLIKQFQQGGPEETSSVP